MLRVDVLIFCRRETFGPTHRLRSPSSSSLKKPRGKHPTVGSDHSIMTGGCPSLVTPEWPTVL